LERGAHGPTWRAADISDGSLMTCEVAMTQFLDCTRICQPAVKENSSI